MKYIIDIPEEYENDYIGISPILGKEFCWPIQNMNKTYIIPTGLKIEPYTEPDRQAIEDEVWEFAKKLISMSGNEVSDMMGCTTNFGEVMYNITYSEAKAKYNAWKKQKDEIRVGDEIIPLNTPYDKSVVTNLWKITCGDEWVVAIARDGKACHYLKKGIKKTGRHFDEVEELLKKMRDETDD